MKKMWSIGLYLVGASALLPATAFGSVAAGVPEISPGSISAGLALLAGGVLVLRTRRSK